jgi:hypothetical protein
MYQREPSRRWSQARASGGAVDRHWFDEGDLELPRDGHDPVEQGDVAEDLVEHGRRPSTVRHLRSAPRCRRSM